ncbi:MAG: tetratricopeptide repeat/ClpX C4-type zinc finger protein [Myxococcaceae bacterium]|nr:tetratricopeptide repeat/ClpX C4-type zinc finger protein [Myxococcaceae bacterium]
MSDARQLLADAQTAEVKGDKAEAIKLLRKVAEIYRDKQLGTKALKVLRHIRRLEGVDEAAHDEGVMPFETQVFEGPTPARTMPERGPVLADPAVEAWCSFCCRPNSEVGRLVAAPTGTFICAACLKAATAMLLT